MTLNQMRNLAFGVKVSSDSLFREEHSKPNLHLGL